MHSLVPSVNMPALPKWLGESANTVTFDRQYLLLAVAMYTIGLIMVASSSMPVAERLFDNPFHFVVRHGVYICLSIFIGALALMIPMSEWQKYSGYMLLAAIIFCFPMHSL